MQVCLRVQAIYVVTKTLSQLGESPGSLDLTHKTQPPSEPIFSLQAHGALTRADTAPEQAQDFQSEILQEVILQL